MKPYFLHVRPDGTETRFARQPMPPLRSLQVGQLADRTEETFTLRRPPSKAIYPPPGQGWTLYDISDQFATWRRRRQRKGKRKAE